MGPKKWPTRAQGGDTTLWLTSVNPALRSATMERLLFFRRAEPQARYGQPLGGLIAQSGLLHPEEGGGPPAGLLDRLFRPRNKPRLLDASAEILLVELKADNRLDRSLKGQKGECRRHELENNRAVFELAPEATDRGSQYAAVVRDHLGAGIFERRARFAFPCRATVAYGLAAEPAGGCGGGSDPRQRRALPKALPVLQVICQGLPVSYGSG